MTKKSHSKVMMVAGAAALALALPATQAEAAPGSGSSVSPSRVTGPSGIQRRGVQLEGLIGGSGCIPGRAPCRYETQFFSGYTAPSLGLGATLGWRATPWLMVGGLYRMGMFNPRYQGANAGYSVATQHTVAALVRPILPMGRVDLGVNLAPGFGRQTFHFDGNNDRDYSQGFSMLVGPTIDVWLTPRFFMGAEVDFVLNSQSRVCRQRGGADVCSVSSTNEVAPTHQSLFGLHVGGTIF